MTVSDELESVVWPRMSTRESKPLRSVHRQTDQTQERLLSGTDWLLARREEQKKEKKGIKVNLQRFYDHLAAAECKGGGQVPDGF